MDEGLGFRALMEPWWLQAADQRLVIAQTTASNACLAERCAQAHTRKVEEKEHPAGAGMATHQSKMGEWAAEVEVWKRAQT